MNKIAIALAASLLAMTGAHATESMPLCSSPLPPDCVDPKWGQIDPDSLVSGGPSADVPSAMKQAGASSMHMAVQMMPTAAARSSSTGPAALKAELDGGRLFARETAALLAAIKKAKFDREGNVVVGRAQIESAAETARKAGAGYELTLYIKSPAGVTADHAKVIASKVRTLNRLLGQPTPPAGTSPKS